MNLMYREYKNVIKVIIQIAPEFLASDVAMMSLLSGVGNINDSKYSQKEFSKLIKKGKVLVAMLRDDPIAYAIINDKHEVVESYISYSFKESNITENFNDFLAEM